MTLVDTYALQRIAVPYSPYGGTHLMTPHLRHPLIIAGSLIALLLVLLACGSAGSIATGSTATATLAPTATLLPTSTATLVPTTIPTPAPGVCNAADFLTKTNGGPGFGFAYPPLTYYFAELPGAGHEPFVMCSSGTPASILIALKNAFPAGGWTISGSNATTIFVEKPTSPPTADCFTIDLIVGGHPGYPGEWDIDAHPPEITC